MTDTGMTDTELRPGVLRVRHELERCRGVLGRAQGGLATGGHPRLRA